MSELPFHITDPPQGLTEGIWKGACEIYFGWFGVCQFNICVCQDRTLDQNTKLKGNTINKTPLKENYVYSFSTVSQSFKIFQLCMPRHIKALALVGYGSPAP